MTGFVYVNLYELANPHHRQSILDQTKGLRKGRYVSCAGAYSSASQAMEKAYAVNKRLHRAGPSKIYARVDVSFHKDAINPAESSD